MFTALVASSGCSIFEPGGLEVSLSVDDPIVDSDDAMRITVVATNVGSQAVDIVPETCPPAFEVVDADGEVVAPGPVLCPLILIAPLRLEGGESHTAIYEWRGEGAPDGEALPRGIYRLHAWVDVIDGERRWTRRERIFVR